MKAQPPTYTECDVEGALKIVRAIRDASGATRRSELNKVIAVILYLTTRIKLLEKK